LGQAPRGLKATIQGGGEHKENSEQKEDSRKGFQDNYTKNQTKQKPHSIEKIQFFYIGELVYGTTKLERIFNLVDFDRD
jgi:hypothetical protein